MEGGATTLELTRKGEALDEERELAGDAGAEVTKRDFLVVATKFDGALRLRRTGPGTVEASARMRTRR